MPTVKTGPEAGQIAGETVKRTKASTAAIETGGSATQKTAAGVATERKRNQRARKERARRVWASA